LDTANEKLGLASQVAQTEGEIMEETGKKVADDGTKFKQLAEDVAEMLFLVRRGRSSIG
jgi:hypothetical protein